MVATEIVVVLDAGRLIQMDELGRRNLRKDFLDSILATIVSKKVKCQFL
jgi:hypothetical protein